MSNSARLALPFLAAGQAQKEILHNEALQALDLIVAANVLEVARNDPPATPAVGACYIVGAAPTGAWAGKSNQLAGMTTGGWRFIDPTEGMSVNIQPTGVQAVYRGSTWEIGLVRASNLSIGGNNVVGARQPSIADPTGGTTIDSQARGTIVQILNALRQHGLIAP